MDYSMPGFPVLQHLLELALTHVHWISGISEVSGISESLNPTISSSVVPFSSCLQSFPASGFFPMSRLFTSGGQRIGASISASVLPMNIQGWFPLGLTGLISLQSKGLKSLLQHHSWKASILRHSAFFIVQLSHPYMTTGKTIALTIPTFVGKLMSRLFNMLSRFVEIFYNYAINISIVESHLQLSFPLHYNWTLLLGLGRWYQAC